MPNYWNHDRKRNTLEKFPKLSMKRFKEQVSKKLDGEERGAVLLSTGEIVNITSTPCHIGGHRYWWECPGCKRRVANLYQHQQYFRCRHCLNAVHASTQGMKKDRALDQIWKNIRKYNLEADGFTTLGEWHRPKGMHRATWQKIQWRHNRQVEKNLGFIQAYLDSLNYATKR